MNTELFRQQLQQIVNHHQRANNRINCLMLIGFLALVVLLNVILH